MAKKTEIRMIKNGKAPAHLNQLCTSLVLLQGVTKISPLLQLRWLTKNHTPPWKSILPTGQHSTSNNLASESPVTTLSVWFLEKSTLFPLRFDIYRTTRIGPIFFFLSLAL